MSSTKVSWEIVVAGLAFVGFAIFLMNRNSTESTDAHRSAAHVSAPSTPAPPQPPLPTSIVIDLNNLENLRNLENLKNLKNLKNLEINLQNLDKVIREHTAHINSSVEVSVDQSLKELETELEKIEQGDYRVKLQNSKVYINKEYNVDEARWTEVSSGVYVFSESIDVANLQSFNLKLGFGNINIVGSDDATAKVLLRATGDISNTSEFSEKFSISKALSEEEASFAISSSQPYDLSNRVNLEATLTLPRDVTVNASTVGGHISAQNLSGRQQIKTSGGHITLDGISGTTIAETNGGHITCDEVFGETTLSTSGGHIKIDKAEGKLIAKTGGGNIDLVGLRGEGEVKTSGGNITASVTEATGPIAFSTSAGNISLALPGSLGADLEAKGNSVTLDKEFQFAGSREKGTVSGKLNGGGVPITISCGFGNVSITHEQ